MKKNKFKIKNIIHIFKEDLLEIRNNRILLIILIGLTIIPSLYAWFNIKAFWDPYGSTKYLKVAIVNQDKGSSFREQNFIFGNKIVENLKENNLLDWQFVNENKAKKGLANGTYYAVLLIPEDFSKDLLSFTEENVKKAKIKYYVNEKINAIAPKITDKGAGTLQNKISQTLVENISEITLTSLGNASALVGDVDEKFDTIKSSLLTLDQQLSNAEKIIEANNSSLDTMSESINLAKDSMPSVDKTLSDSKKLSKEIEDLLNKSNSSFKDLSPSIKKDLELSSGLIKQTNALVYSLSYSKSKTTDDMLLVLNRAQSKLQFSISNTEGVLNILNRLNLLNTPILNKAIDSLQSYLNLLIKYNSKITNAIINIQTNNNLSDSLARELTILADDINEKTDNLINNFDSNIARPIDKISSGSSQVAGDIANLIDQTNKVTPNLNNLYQNISSINSNLKNTTDFTSNSILLLRTQVKDSIDAIDKIQNSNKFKDFNKVIKSNIMNRVDFLKNPINLEENRLYSMANYGSAMTPFYSVLAAWVGGLVLTALLSTKVHRKCTPLEEYFSRLLLFLSLAVIQSLIISLGNLFILGVTMKHPIIFILILAFCSLVFTTIIYSLVSVFGNIGKALCIFLLVIQIGGSGGTFPIQMTPDFFKAINSIIPFTYAIGACREAVGGIYKANLEKDIFALLIFFILAILFCFFFKEPINRLSKPFNDKLNSSSLVGH
ncbi:MAG: YhgE/Pip family protein [Peptoniphilaceae bacterium]